ncbi:PdaC/SigV domain-containing protein [Rhodopseudomonas sp. NSM]|uniref:PdaC/SigV domain-containing protein n=1 Tax=Rhodopseudomonas sp. NSM TaxID=3457630 RepID=UPI00403678F2
MINLWRHALACLLALLLLSPALAEPAKPKPDFAVKTKAIDGQVLLDAPIRADPKLAENCLAEGKKWIAENRTEAEQEFKSDPELFRNGAWTYERSYTVSSLVADRYVSIVRTDYSYTGGAHPNTDINTILWDKAQGKRISIRPFFTETADGGPAMKAMVTGVLASLKTEKKARGADDSDTDYVKSIAPNLLKIGAVTLTPSTEAGKSAGLTFHYPPYAVGAYAEGAYNAYVPWQTLTPHLSAEGAAIFSGERPKGDDDRAR